MSSYNLLSRNIGLKINNTPAVADYITEGSYDIVCLQEAVQAIDIGVKSQYRSYNDLTSSLGYSHEFFGDVRESDGSPRAKEKYGGIFRQGNAVLSTYPFSMATNKFYSGHFQRRAFGSLVRDGDHGRALTHTIVDLPEHQQIQLINLHGCFTTDKKDSPALLNQSRFILEQIKEYDLPTIVVGDFNADNSTQSIALMRERFTDLTHVYGIETTRPAFDDGSESSEGNQVIDYIFVSDEVSVEEFTVDQNTISDHYPLQMRFKLV